MTTLIDPGSIEFEADVQGEGGGTWVDVPLDLKETYGKGNMVPIVATFNEPLDYTSATNVENYALDPRISYRSLAASR